MKYKYQKVVGFTITAAGRLRLSWEEGRAIPLGYFLGRFPQLNLLFDNAIKTSADCSPRPPQTQAPAHPPQGNQDLTAPLATLSPPPFQT